MKGIVISVKVKSYYAAITVRTKDEKVLVRLEGDFLSNSSQRDKLYDLVGRSIKATGIISLPDGQRNPGSFDYKKYLLSQNIHTICKVSIYKLEGREIEFHILHFLSHQKSKFYDAVIPYLSEEGFSMLAGVMFGETSYMDDDIYSSFKENGIAHILAVSGLHVEMMYGIITKLLKKKGLVTDILSIGLVLTYAALANFSTSVIRASLMIIIKIIAKNLNKRYDSVSSASLVCTIILLINPYKIYDSGMQLSFCAVYSMAIISPWLHTKFSKFSDTKKSETFYRISDIALPGISAAIGTGPLCAYHFFIFSPISLILNPVVIALAGIFLPFCVSAFAIYLILPGSIAKILLFILSNTIEGFSNLLVFVSSLGSKISFLQINTAPPLGALILYYLLLFFFFSETRYILHRKNKMFELNIIEALLITLGTVVPCAAGHTNSVNPFDYGVAKITFLDVGQGDCIHIHNGNTDILIDGGGSYYSNIAEKTLKPYLQRNGIKDIDLAIITHEDMDHCKGIYELSEIFNVKKIVNNKDIYGENGLDENDSCIVSSLELYGLSFLFMADADIKREDYLIENRFIKKSDVLKIGHHGSAYSTGENLLQTAKPKFAVISVGAGNNYGHPAGRVLNLLNEYNIPYARTDLYGAICLRKVTSEYFIFENAAKTIEWKIPF